MEYSKSVKPFISEKNCGDFAFLLDCEDSYLICIGDIGGHGNFKIYELALKIEKEVTLNKENKIFDLFNHISSMKSVKEYGMTLFIGRVNKELPVLHYICIGNLKLHLIKKNHVNILKKQNGVIGLEIPSTIEHNLIKLSDNTSIIISTDGINDYSNYLSEIVNIDDLKTISNTLINNFALKDDDALCFVFKYSGNNIQVRKKIHNNTFINNEKIDIPNYEEIVETSNDVSNSQSEVFALEKKYLFVSINNSLLSRTKVNTMVEYLQFDKMTSIRVQTIILELLKFDIVHLDVYVNEYTFQIHTPLNEELVKKIIPLFYDAKFNYIKDKFIIEFKILKYININDDEYKELKQMLFVGLDKKNYEIYKKEKEKDKMLTNQSKLASMGEMIGSIAHQWRQPLNEIGIKVQKLKYYYRKNKIDEDFIDNHIKSSMNTIKFMSQTIDDFRNFFRVDKKKTIFQIQSSIEEIINIQKAQLKNHDIEVEIKGKDFNFLGLKTEFQQVILNLISNSKDAFIKNKVSKAKIKIELKENKIEIKDNAGGIKDSIIDRVFEPYFTTKEQGEGTGMGLYMSKMIIEDNLNGKINISNINNGIKVSIFLGI
ncbi:sensor histidine kinase [Arcobacter sp. YIC-80]|uniref:sensor histidine kinase n=1 Tax=Arcobacter sp. YIC-80 TaxID=3376683 RepID=UPI00384BEC40